MIDLTQYDLCVLTTLIGSLHKLHINNDNYKIELLNN
jgi:hypothetical protein